MTIEGDPLNTEDTCHVEEDSRQTYLPCYSVLGLEAFACLQQLPVPALLAPCFRHYLCSFGCLHHPLLPFLEHACAWWLAGSACIIILVNAGGALSTPPLEMKPRGEREATNAAAAAAYPVSCLFGLLGCSVSSLLGCR